MTWGQPEKDNWLKSQFIRRSYRDEVVKKIMLLSADFEIKQYGALSLNPDLYPVYILHSKKFDAAKKSVLITGGVHGYETSGVHGALGFLERSARKYFEAFNIVCAPCLSPWAFETINRWNPKAIDPNRSFHENSPAEECRLFLNAIRSLDLRPYAHFDLHETTDTDNTVFRPLLQERDGVEEELSEIPDGFYVVGDADNPQKEFQKAVIDAVKKITHIALPDAAGRIIGVPIEQPGVINYPMRELFLCGGFSQAEFTTTTEVYPDSPKVTPAICIGAQIAAIEGGLRYLLGER